VGDWRESAACAAACAEGRAEPDDWFPVRGADYGPARAICSGCAVKMECLESCLDYESTAKAKDRSGMYGGLSPQQRARLARQRRAVAV
jgi:WhiB family redox-sensing transcriptional regulator